MDKIKLENIKPDPLYYVGMSEPFVETTVFVLEKYTEVIGTLLSRITKTSVEFVILGTKVAGKMDSVIELDTTDRIIEYFSYGFEDIKEDVMLLTKELEHI